MNKVKAFFIALRPFAWPWMVVNTLFGVSLAGFNLSKWLLALIIVICVLTAGHLLNSFRDFVKGLDKPDKGSAAKPYTAGSQVLPQGWLSPRTVKVSAIALFALSGLLLLFAPTRIEVYLLYGLGVSMALTYTDLFKPKSLGEVSLFLGHGVGATSFAYSIVKPLDITGFSAGILLGFWAAIVYTIDQWQDVTTDFAKKVKTFAYMVFRANMRISQLWNFLVTGGLVMQASIVLMGWLPPETLVTIFLLPLAYVTSVLLDYQFEKGVLLALVTMWSYATVASLGLFL